MELLDLLMNRRSIRSYNGRSIPEELLEKVLYAGLLSASSRGRREWEFILIKDKQMLEKLAGSRTGSANMLKGADAAIALFADEKACDVWIEDCAIAMSNMHLMADSLGLGSCWIQGRLREAADGRTTEDYVKELLQVPDGFRLEAMLSLGMIDSHPEGYALSDIDRNKIHRERF